MNLQQCTCGSFTKVHKKTCPLNPHNLYSDKEQPSSSVIKTSAPNTKTGIPLVTTSSQDVTSKRLFEEKSDVQLFCICNQEESGRMILCDNDNCSIEWFHYECVGIKRKPKGEWFCPLCSENKDNNSDEGLVQGEHAILVISPPPTDFGLQVQLKL